MSLTGQGRQTYQILRDFLDGKDGKFKDPLNMEKLIILMFNFS